MSLLIERYAMGVPIDGTSIEENIDILRSAARNEPNHGNFIVNLPSVFRVLSDSIVAAEHET